MKILTILDKIDEKQLFVPAFQREYVWKRDDAKQLIDSLVKEYPTGTMLLWETATPPELKGSYKYDAKQGAIRVLLDGQQRITTLYMLIRGQIPPYYTAAEITNDTRGLYVNLETLELLYYSKTRMENNPLWQNITDIFQRRVRARDVVRALEAKGETVDRARDDLIDDNANKIENILSREFPEQTIPVKATIRDAIDIFYKVNASGVALTDAELALAQISGYWPQARVRFKAKLASLEKEGFVLKLDFLVYVLLGCLHHMGSDMKRLHGAENKEKLQAAWERLEKQVFDYVANLLRTYAYVDHTAEINSPYALVPLTVYCYDKGDQALTEAEIRKMVKWFYYSQMRTRYSSQLPQKLDHDLRILVDSPQPFDDLLHVIEEDSRLEILPHEFEGRAVQHPLFGMVRWYLKSRGAICLTTGLGLRKNMGSKYQLELDHIFPYSQLKDAGYGWENRVKYALAQELTNRAILTKVANRSKSDTSAEEYLTGVRKRFPHALELQCIPDCDELWKIDNYELFLKERRKQLADQLNTFLNNITTTEQTAVPVSIEDMILKGESVELEFKSSLRWDVQQGTLNKKLEEVVLKTVAAFANSQGGTLLIGVADDGTILGLEHDYSSLGEADRDKFEIHLRNLFNEQFGVTFVSTRLQIRFYRVADQDVCLIEVAPSTHPVVLKVKNKDGQPQEKVYIRSGNSSQELTMSEMSTYLKDHFR